MTSRTTIPPRGFSQQRLLIYLLLSLGGIAMILPLIWMVSASFKPLGEVMQIPPTWIPRQPTLDNYREVFRQFPFARYIWNSLLVAAVVVGSVLFTSALGGYALAKYRFRGREFVFLAIMTSLMIPFQVRMLPLYRMMVEARLTNTFVGLVFPWLTDAFGIFLMRQFMRTVPDEIVEAGRIDGCSEFQIFWRLVLPQTRPALAALGIFTFTNTWEEFLWPLIITNSDLTRTLPVGLQYFNEQYGLNIHWQMAGAMFAILPVLLVFFLLQKQFVEGITLTGLK
ncbi:MAG: carbohydrate ABC transporter permease [Actinobacteria bacterium]|nr:carbohydrate ABC transporter permease [Actinomycetota bacterium]